MNPVILESVEMEPFEGDDEDYTPFIDPEEDEDETDEVKPQLWVIISTSFLACQDRLVLSNVLFFREFVSWHYTVIFLS